VVRPVSFHGENSLFVFDADSSSSQNPSPKCFSFPEEADARVAPNSVVVSAASSTCTAERAARLDGDEVGPACEVVEERRENIQATIHVAASGEVEAASRKTDDPRLRYKSCGYRRLSSTLHAAIPPFTGLMLSGCYKIPAIGIEVRAAFTNKMSTTPYRGAGRPEATYVIER